MIEIMHAADPGFSAFIKKLSTRGDTPPSEILDTVGTIIQAVKSRGDDALIEYTRNFDNLTLSPDRIEISQQELKQAAALLPEGEMKTIETAAARIDAYHKHQSLDSFTFLDEYGNRLGQIVRPLALVGIYVPGGRAPYPSTLLMNAIPARVAGVREIIAVHPTPADRLTPAIAAAVDLSGVDRIFRVGGAQAVAALAFGTQTIPKVDKIVGPGNLYVAVAKRMLFGVVDIDMIAGPSEVLIVADQAADPQYIAADLLAQAEHDPAASAILVTTQESLAQRVREELNLQLAALSRREIAEQSLADYGALIIVSDIEEAMQVANDIAPEHLELMVDQPKRIISKVENAGAVFLGALSPEAVGDYAAGPNHVLPTGGTARFCSPLSVYDFVKRISVIEMSTEGFNAVGPVAEEFSRIEGLDAHGRAVGIRSSKTK
jgi:histidinol dehydrogenase